MLVAYFRAVCTASDALPFHVYQRAADLECCNEKNSCVDAVRSDHEHELYGQFIYKPPVVKRGTARVSVVHYQFVSHD